METEAERINILMVDDSPTNLLALESILQAPDRTLVSASSGDDALRYLLDHEVAVILMDVYMPGLDGLETAELIRGRDRSRNIPIIFLTADSTGGRHLSRGYSLGAVDYIVKPIEPDILRSKVAVFVELFKKTQEIKRQAQLLQEKNLELENANLARLGMLIDLGQELTAEHDPGRVLKNFCRSARQIVDAQESGVAVFEGDGKSLRYFFRCGVNETDGSNKTVSPPVQRALKHMITKRRTLRLNDTDQLLHTNGDASQVVQSFLGAPIMTGPEIIGWLYLLNKVNAEDFTEADERLAATLTNQVAVAYENATLYSGAQRHASELQLEIAERKQAEEERAQLLIREQAARAEAEQANRTKDEFLATLSHELRTPLSAILGWSQLVRSGKLDEAQIARAFETIERNARSQSQLIDDLLDVSRIITGKLQIEPSLVDLSSVLEAALEAVRPTIAAKSLKLETHFDKEPCLVLGDPNRIQQVFWNLISNAIKFTPEGGQVRVEAKRVNGSVKTIITDTGVGISKEFLPYIFDRFRQADGSTTRIHGGLGLGLSIVKHLVHLHGGTVEVSSDGKDQGSTFTVTLPLASTTPVATDEVTVVEPEMKLPPPESTKLLEGLRVLVVDDECDSRDLVKAILTRYGSEGDIGMPGEDGYSLIRKIRKMKSKQMRDIPAVALTAYVTQEDCESAIKAGFQLHVAKPVEPADLVRSIASVTGRKIS